MFSYKQTFLIMTIRLFLPLAFLILCSSFSDGDDKKRKKKAYKNYSYIPSGTVHLDDQTYSVMGFHLMNNEVSNLDYREFLAYLERNGETEKLEIARIRTDVWDQAGKSMDPIKKTYHTHPAYEDYPVVGISYEAALLYCEFLKEALNKNNVFKQNEVVEVRLPSRAEWIRAARAGRKNVPYHWGGYYLRNAKGCILANFNAMGSEQITFDRAKGEYVIVDREKREAVYNGALITAPVKSYFPNDFGLYNMCGNVAEMVDGGEIAVGGSWKSTGYDIRVQSTMPADGYSSEVGFRPLLVMKANPLKK